MDTPECKDAMSRQNLLRWLPVALLSCLALTSLVWGSYHGLTRSADLERRMVEVDLLLSRANPYVVPDSTYPPSALPVFALGIGPFLGHPAVVRALGLLLNLLALGVTCRELLRLRSSPWPTWATWLFLAVLVASKPVRLTMGMGQFSLIPLAAMLVAARLLRQGREVAAGSLLALALVKPTLSLPFVVLLIVRGHVRAVLTALVFHGASMALVCGWLGLGPLQLLREWHQNAGMQTAAGLIDLPSVLARVWPWMQASSSLVTGGLLLGGSLFLWAIRERPWSQGMAFACFLAAVFTYHRPYDLVLLFPAFLLVADVAAGWEMKGRYWLGTALVLFGVVLIAPAHRLVMPEAVYEAVVIPSCYLLLGLVAWLSLGRRGESTASASASFAQVKSPAAAWAEAGLGSRA